MSYIKLLAIKIGDFSSTIEFEQNYSITEKEFYDSKKKELKNEGLVCILANVKSDLNL